MYTTRDSSFEVPVVDARIWRYSNLAKFIRVLQRRALFFSSAAKLTDVYEGNLTRPSLLKWVQSITHHTNLSNQLAAESAVSARAMVAVNCWHLNENESAAMWQLYSRDDQGIAITSTFGRLVKSFDECGHHIWIGKVQYIDYAQHDLSNSNDIKQWFAHKRREFAHEQELRAIALIDPGESGTEVSCDLRVLMESIRIAPAAPAYMGDLVLELCRRFDITVEVKSSAIDDPPPTWNAAEAN